MTAINSNRAIRGPVTAVPVVAGKGVRLVADTDNNRWVVEADETVLFEKTWNDQKWSETLSEPITNFERIRIEWSRGDSGLVAYTYNVTEHYVGKINNVAMMQCADIDYPGGAVYRYFTIYKINGSSYVESYASYYQYGGTLTGWQTTNVWLHPIKIIGINRISASA